MTEPYDFYDAMAPWHHLIFEDWDLSIARQAQALDALIRERWGAEVRSILDVSCGIGTQSLGLAALGYQVTASDLSPKALDRARAESYVRGLDISFSICDMRKAHEHHKRGFDVVLSCDNSLPHLLSDADILTALREMYRCIRPGGGCLITVRDYDQEPRGRGIMKPYGVRETADARVAIFQVWDFEGDCYHLSMYFAVENRAGGAVTTHIMRTKYYAIGTGRLVALMQEAGFTAVERLDDRFYQPVLVGDRKTQ
jgi:SAM-dependent methyltransferase